MSEQVPEGWGVNSLSDLSKKITDGSHYSPPTVENGCPIATVENMRHSTIDISSCRSISEEEFTNLTANSCNPKIGDVLFSKDGTIGKTLVFQQSDNIVVLSSIAIIRTENSKLLPHFLEQFLSSPIFIGELENRKSGSAIRRVVLGDLKSIPIPTPPLPEQKKIASILTSVDEVIEKTQSQIDKLQDLKKGTMNELLTKGIGHTEFKDSELGRIPKSWEVKKLSELLSKNPKNGFSPKETENGDLSLGLGCLRKDGFLPTQLKSIEPSERNKDFLLKDGDFLMSRSNTRELVGLVGIFRDFGRGCIYPDLMMRLTFKKSANVDFILQMLLSSALRTQISRLAQGTSETMVKLNSQIVKDIRIPVPPDIEQDGIIRIISPINKCLSDKKQKLHQTQSLKKSLMQDLLTGKVRVSVN